ncbi:poly-gamma-glutamate system protein [bacterium]|nr:poly-gamma-glutamate system protein [bacterium]
MARGGIRAGWLAAALAVAAAGFGLVRLTRKAEPYPLREVQLAAARRMEAAERILKERIVAEGIPVEAEDLNGTGLIGPEWTALTSTLGILEAKRTTLNPNFAALMVRYFREAGLEPGDVVAVGASGSFPGLAIATLCAAEEMGLRALTIASFGASMYGATRPEMTIPRMLKLLAGAGVLPDTLIAVSPGSDFDHGENPLFEDARRLIAGLAAETGVEFIDFEAANLEGSIARRLALYGERAGGKTIACFVNVGGASPNNGTSSYTLEFPQGLVLDPPRIPLSRDRGLVYEYASRGIPVVNLLNVRLLADRNGLPYDPVPLPRAGEGGVYYELRYSKVLAVAVIAAVAGLLAAGAAASASARRRAEAGERP